MSTKYFFITTPTKESELIEEAMSLQHELMFDKIISKSQIPKSECYITSNISNIATEITIVKPKVIICMGLMLAKAIFHSKTANQGSRYTLAGIDVFVIESIDTLYRRGNAHMEAAVQTLRRAKECLNLCELATKQNEKL